MADVPLTEIQDSGAVKVGQIVQSVDSSIAGKDLIACDGAEFLSATYPALAALLNASGFVEQQVRTFGGNLLNVTNLTSWFRSCQMASEDASVVYFHNAASTTVGNVHFGRYSSALGTAVQDAVASNSHAIQGVNFVSGCCSDDGGQAFWVATHTTSGQIASWFWNGTTGISASASIMTTTGAFNNDAPLCAMAGDGSLGVVYGFDPSLTNDSKIGYDTSPQFMNSTLSNASVTGLQGNCRACAIAVDGDGSHVYLVDRNNNELYVNTNLTGGGTWSLVGSVPRTDPNHLCNLHCTTDATGLLYSYKPSTTLLNDKTNDRWWISSDSGATCTEIVKTKNFTDALGNPMTATILDIIQKRNGDLAYLIERTDANPVETLPTSHEIVVTSDRSPLWFANTYQAGSHNVNLSEFVSGQMLAHATPSTDQALTVVLNGNTKYLERWDINGGGFYAPLLTNRKIVAG